MHNGQQQSRDGQFIRRTLIVFSLGALFLLIWQMRSLLLLIFGAVLVAVIFRAIADPIRRVTNVPDSVAVAIAVLLVTGILALASWMFGSEVSAQVRTVAESLPGASPEHDRGSSAWQWWWRSFVRRRPLPDVFGRGNR